MHCTFSATNNFVVIVNSQSALVVDSTAVVAEGCSPANNAIDPGETVTMQFALRNTGAVNTTNLVATLFGFRRRDDSKRATELWKFAGRRRGRCTAVYFHGSRLMRRHYHGQPATPGWTAIFGHTHCSVDPRADDHSLHPNL